MLYLTCTMISSVDLACYRVSHAKVWVSVDCGTILNAELNRGSDKMENLMRYLLYRSTKLYIVASNSNGPS